MYKVLIILIFPILLSAQQGEYVFNYQHYTVADGLTHNHVFQTFEGSSGIIWIIAEDGLNRYDGINFKPIPQVKISKNGESVIFLEDEDGDLWIGGSNQPLLCFNILTETVRTAREKFGSNFPQQVCSAVKGKSNTYLLQTSLDSIKRFTPGKGISDLYSKPGKLVAPVVESAEGTVWMEYNNNGRGGEIIAINPAWKTPLVFKYFSDHIYGRGVWKNEGVYYTTPDSFFVVTEKGIHLQREIRSVFPQYHFTDPYITGHFPQIAFDQNDEKFWFSFQGDLILFDDNLKMLSDFGNTNPALISQQIYQIRIDKQQIAWLSTFDGLYKIRCIANPFQQYLSESAVDDSQGERKSCRSIQKGKDGHIYVVSENCLFRISHYRDKSVLCRPKARGGDMLAIYADSVGNIWFEDQNLYRYNIYKKKTDEFVLKNRSPQSRSWVLHQDGIRLWMGNPLSWFDMQDESYHVFDQFNAYEGLQDATIYSIQKASDGRLWLVSNNGLYLLEKEKGISAHYWSGGKGEFYLPSNDLRQMYVDHDGSWWIATAEGLIHTDSRRGQYRLFTTEDGLSHNMCHSVIPDGLGFLWISSDYGLMQFELSTGRVKTYYEADGLGMNEMNRISYFCDADSTLYFGGVNGVVSFHPKIFAHQFDKRDNINLIMTECHVFSGKTDQEEDVRADYVCKNEITMNPGDLFARLRFALTDYTNSERTFYEYKIEGHKDEWQRSTENILRLAGLPYGKHVLVVKARSADGSYAARELRINIRVVRPIYLQIWFLIPLAVVLSAGMAAYKRYWKNKIAGSSMLSKEMEDDTQKAEPVLLTFSAESQDAHDSTNRQMEDNQLAWSVSATSLSVEDEQLLQDVHRIILEHLDDIEFDASTLYKTIGISKSQLHRKLTALTGLSAGRYIYSVRLEEAKRRILDTNLTIAEIAYQTGFSDPAYFTRLFTKKFEHPPSFFRNEM